MNQKHTNGVTVFPSQICGSQTFSSQYSPFSGRSTFLTWFLGVGDGESGGQQKAGRKMGTKGGRDTTEPTALQENSGWGRKDTEMDGRSMD